ncbi:hypothetical protein ACQ4PT_005901 [Festuca glaucescens]
MEKETSGSSLSGGKDNIEVMMQQLGIKDEDMDDVVFEEQGSPPEEETRWLLIAKDVKTKTLEDNLHIFQFACLGDWEKVTKGGPWTFRGNPVLMAPYDGFTRPSTIELFELDIWIQIQDLPVGYDYMVKALTSKVGKFVSSEPMSSGYEGNFFRVRVKLDVRNPLKNCVSMVRAGKRELYLVKYERLSNWC